MDKNIRKDDRERFLLKEGILSSKVEDHTVKRSQRKTNGSQEWTKQERGGLLLPLLVCKVESMGRRAEYPKRARISGENREIWGKTLPGAKEARFRGKRRPDS